MSDYPEHDRLAAISDQSQTCGEFLEWLQEDGLHLMRWRTDLTDIVPCGPGHIVAFGGHGAMKSPYGGGPPRCMRCGEEERDKGTYEVTGMKGWVSEHRSIQQLLAAFFGIDLDKIETEKRQMLARMRGEAAAP